MLLCDQDSNCKVLLDTFIPLYAGFATGVYGLNPGLFFLPTPGLAVPHPIVISKIAYNIKEIRLSKLMVLYYGNDSPKLYF